MRPMSWYLNQCLIWSRRNRLIWLIFRSSSEDLRQSTTMMTTCILMGKKTNLQFQMIRQCQRLSCKTSVKHLTDSQKIQSGISSWLMNHWCLMLKMGLINQPSVASIWVRQNPVLSRNYRRILFTKSIILRTFLSFKINIKLWEALKLNSEVRVGQSNLQVTKTKT